MGLGYDETNAFLQIVQSQSVQIDELRKILDIVNEQYVQLRAV